MRTPLRLLIAGGRNLPDPLVITEPIAHIALNEPTNARIVVVHGDCPGPNSADQAVAEWIRDCGEYLGVDAEPHPADWDNCGPECPSTPSHRRTKKPGDIYHPGQLDTYCPGAGPRRNAHMVSLGADQMIAAPDPTGPSYGTRGCMKLAQAAGISVWDVTA
jgi:hypothetical protein